MKKYLITGLLHFILVISFGQEPESGLRLSTEDDNTFVEEIVMIKPETNAQENLGAGELLIYPLVTSTVINVIKTSETKKVYIGKFVDMTGKIVKAVELDALHNEINLENFELGDYLLRITSGDKQITEIRITREPAIP
ncbi:MAG TPA: T9SS type A sorting domain-containing protein [Bacteroidales bacterium]|jgi:hypothetical protein|nr:T9SS type A sorting domain-containing protein [Bacteroidales bacterium]